jgi:hypothetical protein
LRDVYPKGEREREREREREEEREIKEVLDAVLLPFLNGRSSFCLAYLDLFRCVDGIVRD